MLTVQPRAVRTHVERLLKSNLKEGRDRGRGVDYSYLSPSSRQHKGQWSAYSCCHAVAMAHVAPEQARQELLTLIASQADDGFIGEVYDWGTRWTDAVRPLIQLPPGERVARSRPIGPPLLAQAVERVAEVTRDTYFAPPLMRALDRYHNWLAVNRAPDGDGLLVIVSPRESCMDNSPAYDEALGLDSNATPLQRRLTERDLDTRHGAVRGDSARMMESGRFYVKDAAVNALYADSLATMARLYRAQGSWQIAAAYAEKAAAVTETMMTKMFDRARGSFCSLVGPAEFRSEPSTVGGLIPLLLDGMPSDLAERIVELHLGNPREFWLHYPVPSVSAMEETFNPRNDRLGWRGPTSVYTNWLVWRGLRRRGFTEPAELLAARTVEMVAQSGLREFYNPLNGDGMGKHGFAWSALALDMASRD